jgi:regulatory protein
LAAKPQPEPASAYADALRRLSRRDHAEAELRRALRRKGFPEAEVEDALGRLRSRGLLNDAAFASRYARSRLGSHGLGRHRVRANLRARGVSRPVTEAGLEAALGEVSEAEALDRLARRYWRAHTRDLPRRRLPKLWAFLLRRGYPAAVVQERLKILWPRLADALEGLDPLEPEES